MRKFKVLFILSSLFLFYPTRRYGMVTDFVNWISRYDNGTTSDLWICFGYPGLHQFFHSINYSFYSLFGVNEWAWYTLASTLHGINAYLVFRFSESILQLSKAKIQPQMPLLVGFLFLCMPYNVEAVVWKACIHYLITTGLIIQSLRWLIEYLKDQKVKYLAYIFIAFVLALFSLELSFIVPLLSLALLLFSKFSTDLKVDLPATFKRIIVPQFLILFSYLLLNRWVIGNFIGHYGADKHFNLAPDLILGNGLKYIAKYLTHSHFWPPLLKIAFYEHINLPGVFFSVCICILAGILFSMFKWQNLSPKLRAGILMFFLFAISLLPIITLYFSKIFLWENDRYGYLASAFIIPCFILLFAQIRWKPVSVLLIAIWSLATVFFFGKMISYCHNAGKLQHALLDNFSVPESAKDVYIIGSPDNYRGLYLFRDYDMKGDFIIKSLKYLKGVGFDKTIHHTAQFKVVELSDKLNVISREDRQFTVSFDQNGNWFMKHGIGLSPYRNDMFDVKKSRWNYTLEIFNPNPNDYIMYSDGLTWKGSFYAN